MSNEVERQFPVRSNSDNSRLKTNDDSLTISEKSGPSQESLHSIDFFKDLDINEVIDILYRRFPKLQSKCGPKLKSFLDDLISTRLQKNNRMDTSVLSNQYMDCSSVEFHSEKCFQLESNVSELDDEDTSSLSSGNYSVYDKNNFFCRRH